MNAVAGFTVPELPPPQSCLAVSASDFDWGCHFRTGYREELVDMGAVSEAL